MTKTNTEIKRYQVILTDTADILADYDTIEEAKKEVEEYRQQDEPHNDKIEEKRDEIKSLYRKLERSNNEEEIDELRGKIYKLEEELSDYINENGDIVSRDEYEIYDAVEGKVID